MYHFIISEQNIDKYDEKNTVCISNPIKADFILYRDPNRDMVGQFALAAEIHNVNLFKPLRETLYKWTKESRDFYLHVLMVKRKLDSDPENPEPIEYEITGFDQAFITNFGEDYNNDTGNKMNLILNQKKNTAIGMAKYDVKKIEINGDSSDLELEETGFSLIDSKKIEKMIKHLELQI